MAKKKANRGRASSREMAAVMFTDVRGYSTLAQDNEALAVQLLDVKQGLANPIIVKHHGRLIKTIGDALMVEFKSALAAVQCAASLQKRLHEYNATRPAGERLVVRIGVHVGDVIRKGSDILGDTVNVAARVEPQAAPGGIAVTQAVYDQVRGKSELSFAALGAHKLKGLKEELSLYAVRLPWESGLPVPKSAGPGFLARLKQHHLFRVVSLYATVGWVLILVANQVFPDIGLTREDVRYLIAAVAILFPIAVALAWTFVPPSRDDPDRYGRWRRLRLRTGMVFSLLAVIVASTSGVYLWKLDSRRSVLADDSQAIIVLPFDRRGEVDGALVNGLQETIENEFANLGTLKVISHRSFPAANGAPLPLKDLFKATGATLALQGSISRSDDKSSYEIKTELIASDGSESLYSTTGNYATSAADVDIEKQNATELAGPVRFLTHSDDWFAKGYPTTKNARAMRLLHQALATLSYFGPPEDRLPLIRQAVAADPNFAQAHAYLAMLIVMTGSLDLQYQKSGEVDSEIAKALALAPGLPEAGLAPAMDDIESGRWDKAESDFRALEPSLPKSYFVHFFRGFALRHLGRWDEALDEFRVSSTLDPYTTRTPLFEGEVGYSERKYQDTVDYLGDAAVRWPLWGNLVMWRAQVDFAERGDVPRLAAVMGGDFGRYNIPPTAPWLIARRIEVSHLEGKHAQVIAALKAFPDHYLNDHEALFGPVLGRSLFTDAFTAESLRLLGREQDAKSLAALSLPSAVDDEAAHPLELAYLARVALLQAFGDQSEAALRTIAPLLAHLSESPDRWSGDDASLSSDAALVLAWTGKKDDAVAILTKSLKAPHGAHAGVLAHDPAWRPLFGVPAFKALLALHGQELAEAK